MKQALHTAIPERLLSREAERASIRAFLEEKVLRRLPGSLYISGAPGTGKTACLNCVLQEMKVRRRGDVSPGAWWGFRFPADRLHVTVRVFSPIRPSCRRCRRWW